MASCAKISYVTEQGIGQMALEWNGEDNEKVLMDPKVKEEHKEKIRKIEAYKEFFYKYYKKETTPIYSETTFLKQKAVTYLVIASKKTQIAPLMTSFPIAGEFPYLGFLKKESAKKYKKELESKGYSTYMRPVFAYTTLNKLPFYDNIISSFFNYEEQQLAETIFHELLHTIFFIKDEVDFNESLAEYFGRMTSYEYFKYSSSEKLKLKEKLESQAKIMQLIATKANQLNKLYADKDKISNSEAIAILKQFLNEDFTPSLEKFCKEENVSKCWPLNQKWNNAMFAAFMTYSKEQNLIEKLHKKTKLSLSEYLVYLEKKYDDYKDSDFDNFAKYLKEKEKL